MSSPAVMAARFLRAVAMGAGLGLYYDFLRPLRLRRTALADFLFLLAAVEAAVRFSFGVCAGDFRLGPAGGLALGGFGWSLGPGRFLRPIFSGFWKISERIWVTLLFPVKKFLDFEKNVLASGKKWVTIKWNNRRQTRQIPGGVSHDTKHPLSVCSTAQQSHHQNRGHAGHPAVDGSTHRPALDSHRY